MFTIPSLEPLKRETKGVPSFEAFSTIGSRSKSSFGSLPSRWVIVRRLNAAAIGQLTIVRPSCRRATHSRSQL